MFCQIVIISKPIYIYIYVIQQTLRVTVFKIFNSVYKNMIFTLCRSFESNSFLKVTINEWFKNILYAILLRCNIQR